MGSFGFLQISDHEKSKCKHPPRRLRQSPQEAHTRCEIVEARIVDLFPYCRITLMRPSVDRTAIWSTCIKWLVQTVQFYPRKHTVQKAMSVLCKHQSQNSRHLFITVVSETPNRLGKLIRYHPDTSMLKILKWPWGPSDPKRNTRIEISQLVSQISPLTNSTSSADASSPHIHFQDHDLVLGSLAHFSAILLEEFLAHVDLVRLPFLYQTQLAKFFPAEREKTQSDAFCKCQTVLTIVNHLSLVLWQTPRNRKMYVLNECLMGTFVCSW